MTSDRRRLLKGMAKKYLAAPDKIVPSNGKDWENTFIMTAMIQRILKVKQNETQKEGE